jgi:hypothetical protein
VYKSCGSPSQVSQGDVLYYFFCLIFIAIMALNRLRQNGSKESDYMWHDNFAYIYIYHNINYISAYTYVSNKRGAQIVLVLLSGHYFKFR